MDEKWNIDRFLSPGTFPRASSTSSILITSILLVYIIAFTGNAILILLIWVDSPPPHPHVYIAQPSLSHWLGVNFYHSSKNGHQLFSGKKNISKVACGTRFSFLALGGGECLLFDLVLWPLCGHLQPLRYTVIMNPRVCLQMALVSWGRRC